MTISDVQLIWQKMDMCLQQKINDTKMISKNLLMPWTMTEESHLITLMTWLIQLRSIEPSLN